MTDLPIWAQGRAREWLVQCLPEQEMEASLAALLVEVAKEQWIKGSLADKSALLAEVRRVVKVLRAECSPEHAHPDVNACWACDEILARLDKLDTPRPEEKP